MNVSRSVAEAAAVLLGGVAGVGHEVHSDADLAGAVAGGFPVKAIDALKQRGVTEAEVGSLIIKPRTLSHRRADGGRLTVDESDRAARVARGLVLAERAFASRDKAGRWLHRRPPGAWLDRASSCLLRVPSAIVPVPDVDDRNIVINHRHRDAAHITIARIERFAYDPRLLTGLA